jgi:hypothetical protein
MQDNWLIFLIAPINSLAGVVGILLIGLNMLYRKIMY